MLARVGGRAADGHLRYDVFRVAFGLREGPQEVGEVSDLKGGQSGRRRATHGRQQPRVVALEPGVGPGRVGQLLRGQLLHAPGHLVAQELQQAALGTTPKLRARVDLRAGHRSATYKAIIIMNMPIIGGAAG
eukprot:scaffold235719_cov32-Prasinocladus_malaysianus.AAC.1